MPILAALLKGLLAWLWAAWAAFQAQRMALRLGFVAWAAAGYVAVVVLFTALVTPMAQAVFSFGALGAVLGLIFPPVAGTVVAGLAGLWAARVTWQYSYRLLQAALP